MITKRMRASRCSFQTLQNEVLYEGFLQYLLIWSHLVKKNFMENFIFCAVKCNELGSFITQILCYFPL